MLGFNPEDSTVTVVNTLRYKAGPGGAVATATPPEALEELAGTAILR